MKRFLREPLLHFVFLGILLFADNPETEPGVSSPEGALPAPRMEAPLWRRSVTRATTPA